MWHAAMVAIDGALMGKEIFLSPNIESFAGVGGVARGQKSERGVSKFDRVQNSAGFVALKNKSCHAEG